MKAVISLLSSIILISSSKTIDESSTGALLTFPMELDEELYNKSWDVSPAQFGYQQYGGRLEGWLVLPANESYHLECDGGEPAGVNDYIHYIKDKFVDFDDVKEFIMIIDRLDCYFVDKVEVAQALGASGVIICDKRDEDLFTMWMPQDWSDDITIPSVLLKESNCELLYKHLGVSGWHEYAQAADLTYPDVFSINWTIATIEWGLPHPDDKVEWELWTSSNDLLGSEFKHNFDQTAIALDHANDTIFTPHMYILNGTHWGCDDPTLPCKEQCTNSGRYCAVDPEYDLTIGLDGMDVIQENLRSLCVWEYDKEFFDFNAEIDDVMWWDYVVLWDENCGILHQNTSHFNAECAYAQMNKLALDLAPWVQQCIINSGGYGYRNGTNTLLDRETRLRENSSIYALPMVRVNEFLIHGNIDCPPPVTQQTCEVLSAICAGFINGTQPDVCYLTPSPTIPTCIEIEQDCNGTCFGDHLVDECEECLLPSSFKWNNCIGCNSLPDDSSYDCAATCGGSYRQNPCGLCIDSARDDFNTSGIDCDGNCNTGFELDRCGVCQSPDLTNQDWNSCVGCDDVVDSGKINNICGLCMDPADENFADGGKDCKGECGGPYVYDLCGVCTLGDDPDKNQCLGCDGVANSNTEYNDCEYCLVVTAPDFDDYGKDCTGECPTSIATTHYVDECGECLLTSDETWNDCLDVTSIPVPTNTEVERLQKKENELTTVIVVVCIVAFLIIVAACIIIGALWKKQGQIDERFNSLAATYQVMDENPQHSIQVQSSKTSKKGQTVPDQDSGGESS